MTHERRMRVLNGAVDTIRSLRAERDAALERAVKAEAALSDANIALGRSHGREEEMRAALVEYADTANAKISEPEKWQRHLDIEDVLIALGRRLRDGGRDV